MTEAPLNPDSGLLREASRQFAVCNACRYCEGFCPVWPAMERRVSFEKPDLYYLANVCHDCRACYYACPYTEPNELKINIPDVLGRLRLRSYEEYASPKLVPFLKRGRQFVFAAIASILAVAAIALLIGAPQRLIMRHLELGSFYDVFPYLMIVVVGTALGAFVVGNYLYNTVRFYHDIGGKTRNLGPKAVIGGAIDALWHNGFKGGWHNSGEGVGCYHEGAEPSALFLVLHSLVFYGVLSALASTLVAAIYQDVLGVLPPYPLLSLPVVLGVGGGICIVCGTLGFLALERTSGPEVVFNGMDTLNFAFLLTLALTAITGFLTLVFRTTTVMGWVFTLHIGFVLLLFVTAPYGKFVHFTYRFAALVLSRAEGE